METINKYIEFLRLAHIAGSHAAENIINEINFNNKNLELADGYIKIDGRCKLARFIKYNGQRIQYNDKICFVFDNCFIIHYKQKHTKLRFKYSYFQRSEKIIVERAINAIYYVLVQIEPNIEIVIKNRQED